MGEALNGRQEIICDNLRDQRDTKKVPQISLIYADHLLFTVLPVSVYQNQSFQAV